MLSRETRVQLAAMALALLALVSFATIMPNDPGPIWLAAFALVFYGVAFGGAHLYLYMQGEGGAVPRSARGRFVATLGIVLPLWAAGIVLMEERLAGVDATLVIGGLSALVFLAYFVNEVRLGYEEFEASSGSR